MESQQNLTSHKNCQNFKSVKSKKFWLLPSRQGFSLVEALVAAAIISICALGLGMTLNQLTKSRQKTQLVSQSVGLQASLIAALQDPNTYSAGVNQEVLVAMQAGNANPPQPTITVLADPTTNKTFQITAGGAPVYLDANSNVVTAAGSWTDEVSLSPLVYLNSHYAYSYQIRINPKLGSIASLGSANVAAPTVDANAVLVPTEAINVAAKAKTTACNKANDLAMMGIDSGGNPICIVRAQNQCATTEVAKGFNLQDHQTTPESYSYEFQCQPLRKLVCPAQLMVGGVPDPSFVNPYALQSFIPNTLDESGATPGTGTCVFVGAHSATQNVGTFHNGISVATACPPHYTASTISCTAGADDAQPPTVACASSAPAVPIAPGGTVSSVSAGTVSCQRAVTQVCCGDDHSHCAQIWSGNVSLKYTCKLDSNVSETIPANVVN